MEADEPQAQASPPVDEMLLMEKTDYACPYIRTSYKFFPEPTKGFGSEHLSALIARVQKLWPGRPLCINLWEYWPDPAWAICAQRLEPGASPDWDLPPRGAENAARAARALGDYQVRAIKLTVMERLPPCKGAGGRGARNCEKVGAL